MDVKQGERRDGKERRDVGAAGTGKRSLETGEIDRRERERDR